MPGVKGLGGLGGVAGVFDGGGLIEAYARVYTSTAEDMASGSYQEMNPDTERWDVGGIHDTVSNINRMTAPVDGIYLCTNHIKWEASTLGNIRRLVQRLSDNTIMAARSEINVTVAVGQAQSCFHVYEFAAGDWWSSWVYQNSASNKEVQVFAQQSPELTMHILGQSPGVVAARAYNGADQAIGTGAWTAVPLNTDRYDYGGIHDTGSNTERMVAPSDGIYLAIFQVQFENVGTTGVRIARIYGSDGNGYSVSSSDGTASEVLQCAAIVQLNANDYVQGDVYHNRGSDLDVLGVTGTAWSLSPSFALTKLGELTAPGASAYKGSNQSIPNNSWTTVALDAELWDTDGCWIAGDPTKLTCQTAGYYAIVGSTQFANQLSGTRGGRILLNGATPIASSDYDAEVTGNSVTVCTAYYLDVGDYVQLQAYTNMGLAQNLLYNSRQSPFLTMAKLPDVSA